MHLQPTSSTLTVLHSGKSKKHKYTDNGDGDDDDNSPTFDNDDGDDEDDGSFADSSTPHSGTAGQFKFVRRSPAVLGGPFVNTKPYTVAARYPTTTTADRPLYGSRKYWCTNFGCKNRRVKKVRQRTIGLDLPAICHSTRRFPGGFVKSYGFFKWSGTPCPRPEELRGNLIGKTQRPV